MIYCAIREANSTRNNLLEASGRIENSMRQIEAQGEELNSRIAQLRRASELNLFFDALTQKELSYMNQLGVKERSP